MLTENGNGASVGSTDAVMTGKATVNIVGDPDRGVKRERRNTIRRIRRALSKHCMDLHYHDGDYFLVPVGFYAAIDVERFGREVGAIQTIGYCSFCDKLAWHKVEGVALCDRCAEEVRR
jgi:hypothetical protein